jgi:hypothetical protein
VISPSLCAVFCIFETWLLFIH